MCVGAQPVSRRLPADPEGSRCCDQGPPGLACGPAHALPHGLSPCPAGMWAPGTDAKAVWHMLTSSFLNLMLIALPLGIWAGATEASPTLVFSAVRRPPRRWLRAPATALLLGARSEQPACPSTSHPCLPAPPGTTGHPSRPHTPHPHTSPSPHRHPHPPTPPPPELPGPHPAGPLPGGGDRGPGGALWRHRGRPAQRDVRQRGRAVSARPRAACHRPRTPAARLNLPAKEELALV